jgi:hypothetical protein
VTACSLVGPYHRPEGHFVLSPVQYALQNCPLHSSHVLVLFSPSLIMHPAHPTLENGAVIGATVSWIPCTCYWFSSGPLLLPFNLPIKTALWKATVSPTFQEHLTGLMGHYSAISTFPSKRHFGGPLFPYSFPGLSGPP